MMQDNYLIQAAQAKQYFLGYDQQAIIEKCRLRRDPDYLYTTLLGMPYRVCRETGDVQRLLGDRWISGNSHGEVMTLLDLLCDSREDRHPSLRYRNMQDFGHQFHQNLNEKERDPAALRFQQDPRALRRACRTLGGVPFPTGDVAFTFPVFEDLTLVLQFFLGDEEFSPRLRFLWDENALQYLKYETMYYAVNVLMDRIFEQL